jgi:hypothetical protein
MSYAEERLEAAEKRLDEIAASLFTLRAVGVALWSFVPAFIFASFAIGSSSNASFMYCLFATSDSLLFCESIQRSRAFL